MFIHLVSASYVLLVGLIQLFRRKGTTSHRFIGFSWMAAMVVTALSSFWIESFAPFIFGFGFIHLLSLWVLVCVVASLRGARSHNVQRHRNFAIGAYVGTVGAGLAALAVPGRVLHQLLLS